VTRNKRIGAARIDSGRFENLVSFQKAIAGPALGQSALASGDKRSSLHRIRVVFLQCLRMAAQGRRFQRSAKVSSNPKQDPSAEQLATGQRGNSRDQELHARLRGNPHALGLANRVIATCAPCSNAPGALPPICQRRSPVRSHRTGKMSTPSHLRHCASRWCCRAARCTRPHLSASQRPSPPHLEFFGLLRGLSGAPKPRLKPKTG